MEKGLKKLKIGIDLDECLAEFVWGFFNHHNDLYETKFTKRDIFCYNLWEVIGEKREETTKKILYFYQTDHFKELPIVPQSREVTRVLSENNELFVITARPNSLDYATNRFIDQNFHNRFLDLIFSNDFFKNGKKKKSDICKNLGIEVMIEDHADYAFDCARNGIQVILLDKPWNHFYFRHNNLTKVSNWNECLGEINKLEEVYGN